MPEKKKQHYVPKFYLKFFSIDNKLMHIKMCLKKTGKIIQRIPIESQTQEDYFYGKDLHWENWFGGIEDKCAIILKRIVKTKKLPKNKSDDYYMIWLFILLQAYRTKTNAEEYNRVVDTTLKAVMKLEPKFKDFDFDTHFFAYDDAIEKSLNILLKSLHILLDMQIKLVVNKSSKKLITSDNPISKYNQFLESRKHPWGHLGMASKGLQIFYPLSPNLLLVMYDPRVYKLGFKKQFDGITMVEDDIAALNVLTCLYSNKTLYCTETVKDIIIENALETSRKFQNQRKIETHQSKPEYVDEKNESITVQHLAKPFTIGLKLSFIKQTQHAKSYKMSGYVAELRNEKFRIRENRE